MNEDDTFEALRKPPTEDEIAFGRNAWLYCGQHLRPHMTGWCTVSTRNKIKLEAKTLEEAYEICRDNRWTLFGDKDAY